jgi:hypothetical protein
MNTTDPLGLSEFSTHILGSITTLAPFAVLALFCILGVYGLLRR